MTSYGGLQVQAAPNLERVDYFGEGCRALFETKGEPFETQCMRH
jgi:hypothetical protein